MTLKKYSFLIAIFLLFFGIKADLLIKPNFNFHIFLDEDYVLKQAAEIIKKHEGSALKTYVCPAGRPTIGYGHVVGKKKTYAISVDQAEELLLADMMHAKEAVDRLVKVKLTPNQQAALISFIFNVGATGFEKSKILNLINQNQHDQVPQQMLKWVYAKRKKLKGLVLRREKEALLYACSTPLSTATF